MNKEIPIETVKKFNDKLLKLLTNLENKLNSNHLALNKIIDITRLAVKNMPDTVFNKTGIILVENNELIVSDNIDSSIIAIKGILSGNNKLKKIVDPIVLNSEIDDIYKDLKDSEKKRTHRDFKILLKIYVLAIKN